MKGLALLALLAVVSALATAAFLTLRPASPPVRDDRSVLERAGAAYADRDFARAEELLSGIDSPEADLLRARIRRDTGRVAKARDLFLKVMKSDPKNVEAVQGLAQIYAALRQDDAAIPFWRRLTDLQPDDPHAWRELALAQVRTKDTIGALAAIQRSLELDPQQEDLQFLLAETAMTPLGSSPIARRPSVPTPTPPDPTRHLPQSPWRKP